MNPTDTDLARAAKAWPFVEAQGLLARLGAAAPAKGYVLFETGYGPSGLPHIGTFGEVARTLMVQHAFRQLCDWPTRLFAFSDDMDGLRRVPDNVPNRDMVAAHLGKPLTAIPDPYGTAESYGHNMNGRLKAFLDRFGFAYEFKSATTCYKTGVFDATLKRVLANYEAVRDVILPTLGPERRATYSPFLPICPRTGVVLQVPIVAWDVDAGTVNYRDDRGQLTEVPVTGGHCKLQWKADWAMRWVALGVDYEMSGKDLIDSVRLSSQICRVLGGTPPAGFTYELFLDENGEKISKSRGNGLTIDQWLRYASPASLSLYMYNAPRKAKRLYFDVIPKTVDEYLTHLEKYPGQGRDQQIANPVWHIHGGNPPTATLPITFGILLNLASVVNADAPAILWGFISRYAPDASPATQPILNELVGYAVSYYQDFVKPAKRYRPASPAEAAALGDLGATLGRFAPTADPEAIQFEVYEVGKRHGFAELRAWFKALYEVLLGQSEGPRMGSFIALYGVEETIALIRRALAGEDLAKSSAHQDR
ncbi:MAG: lysine--tRNA ligase [Alphaproteobacteria bacterium]|nr:lysine--tRNA ligase [Alphaproteobacteria bacterium]